MRRVSPSLSLTTRAAPVHLTSAEWKKTHADFKGVGETNTYRVREVLAPGGLKQVYLTDKKACPAPV